MYVLYIMSVRVMRSIFLFFRVNAFGEPRSKRECSRDTRKLRFYLSTLGNGQCFVKPHRDFFYLCRALFNAILITR